LADALESSAASRPNFALRMTFETADNRTCRDHCIRLLASLGRLEAMRKVQETAIGTSNSVYEILPE
jgi:hypothetical protein